MNELRRRMGASRAARFLKAFVRDLADTRTTGMAAEMAFWVFLSLIPLAAVAGLVAARVAVSSAEVGDLLASLPPQTRQLVRDQLSVVAAWNGGSVAAPAAAVFVWLASGGIHAVFDLLEVKAGASRPWWKKRLLAIAICVGLSLGTVVIAVLITGLNRILALVHGVLPYAAMQVKGGWVDSGVRVGMGALVAVGLVGGLYWAAVPRDAKRHLPVWPGALLAVALQLLFGYGYAFYLSEIGSGGAYRTGLSIVGVTLMALYLFAIALLVGAELNHVLSPEGQSTYRPRARLTSPRRGEVDEEVASSREGRDNRPSLSFERSDDQKPSSRIPPTAR